MDKKESQPKAGLPRLMELAGSRAWQLAVACVLSMLAAAARLVPFFTIYGLLRLMVLHYSDISAIPLSEVVWLVGVTAVAAVAYGVFGFVGSSLTHRAAYNTLYELRVQLMEKLSRLPSGYFTATTQGSLKKTIQDDVEKIEEFIAHSITDTVCAITLPLFSMVFLTVMDWRLALCIVFPLVIGIVILTVSLKNPASAKTQAAMHETRRAMNSTIVEYVHGMPVIKVFDRSLSASARLGAHVDAAASATKDAARLFAPAMGRYFAAMGAQLLFILPAGLFIALQATSYIDFLPLLLLFFLVGAGLKEPLENMMSLALSTNSISIGMARVDSILTEKELAVPLSPALPKDNGIVFESVRFSYHENGPWAVDGVSFALRQNTVTGIVGPSGGGKSTVAHLLLRFYEPQFGRISIGGVDIKDIAPGKLMERIGYVFQDSMLFHATVEDNIRMGNSKATRAEVQKAARAAAVHDVIADLPRGYDTVIGEGDTSLSGGEKQRIAIARVFLKNPAIIILDEATAYADAENESLIQESFARLSEGKTVVVIAHRLKTIEHADQILVLDKGRLLAAGTHERLLGQNAAYRRMVEANGMRDAWSIRKAPRKGVVGHV